ncbi:MAG TPA: TlpA disulfide reductase family protein [Bdellovibrionales bacterium]|nr:TlpA disulfide reductase family protein [Bdellovibrionales bacterium]
MGARPALRGYIASVAGFAIACAMGVTGGSAAASAGERLKAGDRFPPVKLRPISKASYKASDHKDKVIVYDVGASWAHGADEALPYYKVLLAKYKKRGLRVVAINIDDDERDALKHIKGVSGEFPVLYDQGKAFVKSIEPEGFPMVYVTNRRGIVRDVIRDYCENEFDLLEKRIVKVLDEK